MKRLPTKRSIYFHGVLAERYQSEPFEIYADSLKNLFGILFKCVYPQLLQERFTLAFEDENGNYTELFDPEQVLHKDQTKVHILPATEGADVLTIIAIVLAVISIGAAFLLAPKVGANQDTATGANWESPENVVGQGGVIPVVLGERLVGSRVASYGIDSTVFVGRA